MRTGLCSLLGSASAENVYDTFVWFLYNIGGSLLPVWGSLILLPLLSKPTVIVDLASHGEFAIYSAALLAPVFYMILKDQGAPLPHRPIFGFLAFVGLLISGILFAGVTSVSSQQTLGQPCTLNVAFLVWATLLLFICTAAMGFLLNLLDLVRTRPDVRGIVQEQQSVLAASFDNLVEEAEEARQPENGAHNEQ